MAGATHACCHGHRQGVAVPDWPRRNRAVPHSTGAANRLLSEATGELVVGLDGGAQRRVCSASDKKDA